MNSLGLFPLHIVLFPQASYPLHIFEDRYKTLINQSLKGESEFGINLVEGGKMFDVGCRVKVTRVLRDYPDGRRDVVVTGTSRYRVSRVRAPEEPYITADVDEVVDDAGTSPEVADVKYTITLYNELLSKAYGNTAELMDPNEWLGKDPTFYMARKSGLDLGQRQRLLESTSQFDRLTMVTDHLNAILPKIRRAELLRKLSRNDGYLAQ